MTEKAVETMLKKASELPDYSQTTRPATYFKSGFRLGYHQAEKDIKEELSNLFQEFMLDCAKDDTETHILHFIDVFNNKIKTIGNE